MEDVEKRRSRAALFKWGIAIIGAAIVAPVAYLAVKGLIGIAIAGGLGLVIVNFAEPVAFRLANLRLKAIRAEAHNNPIETLQNQLIEHRGQLTEFLKNIEDYDETVHSFADQVEQFKKDVPDEAPKYVGILQQMTLLLDRRREAYAKAKSDVEKFAAEVVRQQAIYRMSEAAQRTQQKLSGRAQVTLDIKTDAALSAVQESLNRSMAQLNTALLENNPADVIDIPAKLIGAERHAL